MLKTSQPDLRNILRKITTCPLSRVAHVLLCGEKEHGSFDSLIRNLFSFIMIVIKEKMARDLILPQRNQHTLQGPIAENQCHIDTQKLKLRTVIGTAKPVQNFAREPQQNHKHSTFRSTFCKTIPLLVEQSPHS